MANVTNSGIGQGGPAAGTAEPLTPAEKEKLVVRRAQDGDVSAYEELVRTHQHRVLAVVGGILRGSEDVEDVAQQALAKADFSIRRVGLRPAVRTLVHQIPGDE